LKSERGSISPFGIGISAISVATGLVIYLSGLMLISQHRLQADLDLALLQAHHHSVQELEYPEYSLIQARMRQYFQTNQTQGLSFLDLQVSDFESRVRACSNLSLPFAAMNLSTSVAICAESSAASFDPRDGSRVQS
jgi:hypothetical protein